MSEEILLGRAAEGVATLTLSRPERLNALDGPTVARLRAAIDGLESEWPATRVVVLSGAGSSFCAGADLRWVESEVLGDDAAMAAFLDDLGGLLRRLEASPLVVVAAVHGHAVAGGLEMLLACDVVLVAEGARVGDEHIRRNLVPGAGGTQRLPRKVGRSRGLYALLTGRRLTGAEAVDWGIAHELVADRELLDTALARAAEIAGRDGHALRATKALVRRGTELPLSEALLLELHELRRYRDVSGALDRGVTGFARPDRD
ncbi:enoyl-CoA hydratase/isomerase family protein [Actinomycetospora aeridis]|uniref:Enoyl-CoA hydratase/isomerase family protein n=1 Tax=Actinomycetospora aeridis TaxID=3129231 RepID=A0ABU8NEE9_9PSEU